MIDGRIIGVDVGGTKIGVGLVGGDQISQYKNFSVTANGTEEQVINEVIAAVESVFEDDVHGIGIGVPSLVDVEEGIVYDVQNIPSWKEVHLKKIIENRFHKPVFITNDANCFVVGEKYFGKGKPYSNLVGLTLGTGMGAGIIINNHLYTGVNCGAGEFGSIPYLSHTYEYYCSGQFFVNEYNIEGIKVYEKAMRGDGTALKIYSEFGKHVGNAIIAVLFAVDPEAIFLGGTISKAYRYFKDTMLETVATFPYKRTIKRLVIDVTEKTRIAVLGAAALYYDAQVGKLRVDSK